MHCRSTPAICNGDSLLPGLVTFHPVWRLQIVCTLDCLHLPPGNSLLGFIVNQALGVVFALPVLSGPWLSLPSHPPWFRLLWKAVCHLPGLGHPEFSTGPSGCWPIVSSPGHVTTIPVSWPPKRLWCDAERSRPAVTKLQLANVNLAEDSHCSLDPQVVAFWVNCPCSHYYQSLPSRLRRNVWQDQQPNIKSKLLLLEERVIG